MDFDLPHVVADPSSRPHVEAAKVPQLPRIVGQIMNSMCGEELKKNLSPDSCVCRARIVRCYCQLNTRIIL